MTNPFARTRAKKSLGQNFLIDPNYQKKISSAVQKVFTDQPMLEIGPGRGAITAQLLEFCGTLTLVEKDRDLAAALTEKYIDDERVTVICEDVLKVDFTTLFDGKRALVIGNLPYNVSSQIFIKLLQTGLLWDHLFLMFQKEVALRCTSTRDDKDYGVLSLWTQLFAKAERLFHLPPTAFKPQPKVTSSFVRFDLLHKEFDPEKSFIWFFKTLFTQRRKKISSAMRNHGVEMVDPSDKILSLIDQRAETLTLDELREIFNCTVKTD